MLWYVSGLLRKRLDRQWQCTRTELPRDWPQLSTSCQTPHRAGLAILVAGRGGDSNRSPPVVAPSRTGAVGMIQVMVRYCDVLALTDNRELDLAG